MVVCERVGSSLTVDLCDLSSLAVTDNGCVLEGRVITHCWPLWPEFYLCYWQWLCVRGSGRHSLLTSVTWVLLLLLTVVVCERVGSSLTVDLCDLSSIAVTDNGCVLEGRVVTHCWPLWPEFYCCYWQWLYVRGSGRHSLLTSVTWVLLLLLTMVVCERVGSSLAWTVVFSNKRERGGFLTPGTPYLLPLDLPCCTRENILNENIY
jgi:hypothetical protein